MSAAFDALRARLEAKHEELTKALHALVNSGAADDTGPVEDHLFRLLGIVAFWQSCKEPSPHMLAEVNRQLDKFSITVSRRGAIA